MEASVLKEQETANRLRRSRAIANAALLLAIAGFIAGTRYEDFAPWVSYFRAFCEAAMVGALADWFAVTALFRRPLGLPIPHTAIIPANKDRLGASLGCFVQSNFLSEEVLSAKLDRTDLSGAAAKWLSREENARRVSRRIVGVLPELIGSLDDQDIRKFLHSGLKQLLSETDFSAMLSAALEIVSRSGKLEPVLDELLLSAESLLGEHQRFIQNALLEELPWYVPAFVHKRVYRSVVARILERLEQMRRDPGHTARVFSQAGARFASELTVPGTLSGAVEELKQWLLNTPAFASYADELWSEIKRRATADAASDSSKIEKLLSHLIAASANGVLNDENARTKLNLLAAHNVRRAVRTFRQGFIELVADTVRDWDTGTLVSKLEFEVGRDLQYIRLNGTIVGGGVGLLLHLLQKAL